MEITGTVPLPNSTPVFHTKNLFMFPSTHVKHVSFMEITESTRGKKPHNTHAFLLPTFSFCTHPPRPLLMGLLGALGFVQKNGEGNPIEGPSQVDGSSLFWKAQNVRKIICHLGGLLISMECNSVAALAQDYRPLVSL